MKKVKAIIAIVVIIASIGGALALKASKKASPLVYFYDGPDADVFCDDPFFGYVNSPSGFIDEWYYGSINRSCPYTGRLLQSFF